MATATCEVKAELHENVKHFLAHPVPHHIDGKDLMTGTGKDINPADGTVLAEVAMGGAKEVELAVAAAEKAFPAWAALTPKERAKVLHRYADLLEKHSVELAQMESIDVGKTIGLAEGFDIPFAIQGLRYFADLSVDAQYSVPLDIKGMEARTWRAPYGAVGFIFPWNFLFALLFWGTAPALAAGNTVVVKPSVIAPLSTVYAAQLATEAGLPPGVFNVVVGGGSSVGVALANHPRIKRMSFTGSPEAGTEINVACAHNLVPCKLELGGKGAAVVFEDADLDAVATGLTGAITMNTGQVCCTATRWIIQEKVYDRFVEKAVAILKGTKIGPGIHRETTMGPLASLVQRQRVNGYIELGLQSGARAILDSGVPFPGRGFYVQPTLLEGPDDNVCCREEIFGPSAYLLRFKDEESVIPLVNKLAYGLGNSIWTADLKRANRVAERLICGNNWINAHNVFAYGLPYGGVNLSGLGGGVNSPETFRDYLRPTTIARPL